jgi:GT2 family glycosyltransferase
VTGQPTITIVTPSLNQVEFIEDAIRSVLDQGYPSLEYVVVDGGSDDGSEDIIRRYEDRLHGWVSEPDEGQYHAIERGFSLGTGEIMGWLNADDRYFPWALRTVASIFESEPEVQWLTSLSGATWNALGACIGVTPMVGYSGEAFLDGYYVPWGPESNGSWIQQESTFWRRDLWDAAGARFDPAFPLAGDFELWSRFYEHGPLHATAALLGGFRAHDGAQRSDDRDSYTAEALRALEAARRRAGWTVAVARKASSRLRLARFPGLGPKAGDRLGYTARWVAWTGAGWRIDEPSFLDASAFENAS